MHHEQPYPIADWAGPFLICPIIDMAIVNIMLYPPESYHKDGKVCQVEAFALNFRNSQIALMQIRNASVCSPIAFATCMGNKTHVGFSPIRRPISFTAFYPITYMHFIPAAKKFQLTQE